MSVVRTNAAAAMLGVSPNTLRSWERRFGYPSPQRTSGGHRQFELEQIEALRQAFAETQNISSAISIARARGQGPATPQRLGSSLAEFDESKCDRLLEESLTVRSMERTVEEVLLPAVEAIGGDGDAPAPPPEYGFAWRYASGWLASALRVAPPAHRDESVLVFEATQPCDLDALYVQALELCLRRSGARTLSLMIGVDHARIGSAMRAVAPTAIVVSGPRASLDTLARTVYAARQYGGEIEVFDYRGALPETGASTFCRLAVSPIEASDTLLGRRRARLDNNVTVARVDDAIAAELLSADGAAKRRGVTGARS